MLHQLSFVWLLLASQAHALRLHSESFVKGEQLLDLDWKASDTTIQPWHAFMALLAFNPSPSEAFTFGLGAPRTGFSQSLRNAAVQGTLFNKTPASVLGSSHMVSQGAEPEMFKQGSKVRVQRLNPKMMVSEDIHSGPSDQSAVQPKTDTQLQAAGQGIGGVVSPLPQWLPPALKRRWRRIFGCRSCANSRAVPCPNCDGAGGYEAMGGPRGARGAASIPVACKACRGTGKVVCRDCFVGDGNDIERIRREMGYPD